MYCTSRKRSQALRRDHIYSEKLADAVVDVLETLGLDGDDRLRLRHLDLAEVHTAFTPCCALAQAIANPPILSGSPL